MKRLFLCSSHYTIMNSILVSESLKKNNDIADVIIFERTHCLREIYLKISNMKLFSLVDMLCFINKKPKYILILIFLFPRFLYERLLSLSTSSKIIHNDYDEIYSSSWLYAVFALRFNPTADLYLIEEGLSSYTTRATNPESRSAFFHIIDKVFYKSNLTDKLNGIYLHQPEFTKMTTECFQIHTSLNSKSKLNQLKEVFAYEKDHKYDRSKYIYLGAPFFGLLDLMTPDQIVENGFEVRCNKFVCEIFDIIKPSPIIYRKHLLEIENKCDVGANVGNNIIIDSHSQMWELLTLDKITNNSVILSFFSTASFTPKFVARKEPYLIFLYKLFDYELLNANSLVEELKEIYSDDTKIHTPKTISEVKEILSSIK